MCFAIKNRKNIRGTTLIELLIVSGVVMILGGIGVSTYVNQQRFNVLRNTTEEIMGYLYSSRQKAISQQEGLDWGIHFANPAGSNNDFYALFSGTSFSLARERASLSDFLEFSDPASASSTDIIFQRMTGRLIGGVDKSITIRIIGTNNIAIITVNREGVVSSIITMGVPPADPSGLSASAVSSSQINLSWTDNSGNETRFEIERCTGSACSDFSNIHNTSANAVSHPNTGLFSSTTYRYRVRACNASGCSGWSNIASATTTSGDPCAGQPNNTQVAGCNGTCQACQGGVCANATVDTDPGNQCSATGCLTGNCDGFGACKVFANGAEGFCPACQQCNGTSSSCVNMTDNTQDTTGSNLCNATCVKCSAGACVNQTSAEDLFNQCAATSCAGGNCSGTGASCGVFTDGTSCGTPGPWSACGNCSYASACANSGTGTQSRTISVCSGGSCVISSESQSCTCTRNTDGASCGAPGAWSACGNCSYASACANSGTGTQSRTISVCSGGSCVLSSESQSCTCTRNTDGTSCGTPGAWSACGNCSYTYACANSGTGTQSRTISVCSGGSCVISSESQSCTCTRNTDGASCGAPGPWSACDSCSYASACANSGTGTQSRTISVCFVGSCVLSSESQSCTCTRNTDGISCGTPGAWSACGNCSYTYACANSGTGTQSRTISVCSGGSCVISSESQSCTCTRNTDGASCGAPGPWSACDSCSYASACANSGTGTQSRTTSVCFVGSCVLSSESQSCTCTRNTDGILCSSGTCQSDTHCSGGSCPSPTCFYGTSCGFDLCCHGCGVCGPPPCIIKW